MTYKQLKKDLEIYKRNYFEQVLNNHNGNSTESARYLDLDRSNFLKMCKKLKVNPAEFRNKKYLECPF